MSGLTQEDLQSIKLIIDQSIDSRIDKSIEDMSTVVRDLGEHIDSRFNSLEGSIQESESNYNRLLNTLDHFLKRLDDSESESAARDNQFERLLDWARKVSEKTGIPLENL